MLRYFVIRFRTISGWLEIIVAGREKPRRPEKKPQELFDSRRRNRFRKSEGKTGPSGT